ncbi:hypothetical protein EYZ11_003192 [Aspergillus tanneri]|uniref:PI31 proteasome regulator N-terminal domain-containing protein n=1 Tax=Aspergillus tanneri TaxID=1220188 RepID=A0A4S3JR41_9EURO|nr:hypothetical protein EYZ11_003192 [Aspergillus tanneri]
MATNTDALRPDNVLALADHALRGDETTEFSLKSPYEAIALIGHACMVAVDFRLAGLGEEHTICL